MVGLDSVELAKSRVAQRVRDGGHGIPPEDIERRYTESLENLKKVIPECDCVNIYDNTKSFRMIASFAHLGIPEYFAHMAANSRKGYWRSSNTTTVKRALTKERLIQSGFYDLAIAYQSLHVNY